MINKTFISGDKILIDYDAQTEEFKFTKAVVQPAAQAQPGQPQASQNQTQNGVTPVGQTNQANGLIQEPQATPPPPPIPPVPPAATGESLAMQVNGQAQT